MKETTGNNIVRYAISAAFVSTVLIVASLICIGLDWLTDKTGLPILPSFCIICFVSLVWRVGKGITVSDEEERVVQLEPSKDLEEAARRAAVDKPDTPLEFLMERPYDSDKEQKFIEGAMWQKRHDNIPQELVENYCEFIKEGGKNVCALINAVNACNAKKAECISKDLEEAASQYSFNIPSAIFNDLTPVLQNIWKREIEGAFIAGAKWYKEQLDMCQKEQLKNK